MKTDNTSCCIVSILNRSAAHIVSSSRIYNNYCIGRDVEVDSCDLNGESVPNYAYRLRKITRKVSNDRRLSDPDCGRAPIGYEREDQEYLALNYCMVMNWKSYGRRQL
jgi:hypothetical protein